MISDVSAVNIQKFRSGHFEHVVRGDIVRLLYSEALYRFSLDSVMELVASVAPFGGQQQWSHLELITKIWTHGTMFPTTFAVRFVEAFECLCIRQSVDTAELVNEALTMLKRGSDLPCHIVARALLRKNTLPDHTFDLRQWLLKIQERLFRFSVRQGGFSLVHEQSEESWNSAYCMVTLDKTGSGMVPQGDLDGWIIPKIRVFPMFVNCPPYEEVMSISDCRMPSEAVPEFHSEIKNGICYVNREPVGATVNFREFLCRHNIDGQTVSFNTDKEVVEIHTPVKSIERKREVLHAGCVYGAPVHLLRLKYLKTSGTKEHALDYCIKNTMITRPVWKPIKAKHHLLRSQLATAYHFKYHIRDGAMYLNAQLLVRNIPALILRKLLDLYLAGKPVIERRVLLDDPLIVLDRANPGIEIRIRRLITLMQRLCPLVQIVRSERGVLHVTAHCKVYLDVIP